MKISNISHLVLFFPFTAVFTSVVKEAHPLSDVMRIDINGPFVSSDIKDHYQSQIEAPKSQFFPFKNEDKAPLVAFLPSKGNKPKRKNIFYRPSKNTNSISIPLSYKLYS